MTRYGTPVTTEAQLRSLLAPPLPRNASKERSALDEWDRQWLASSPMCFVATSSADGSCNVSPKGDPAGFALALDDRTVAVPERAGNRRADGFRNILTNPHAGLIFLIPGRGDTLRINGRATLVSDAPFFDQMTVQGHRPILALVVEVQQVFYHCAKAFLRSQIWDPTSWRPDAAPSRARIAKRFERPDDSLADLETYYGPAYLAGLYPHT
jgi:PPOX class probable FMN-dependent enzyme